jgi:hypothetical protein
VVIRILDSRVYDRELAHKEWKVGESYNSWYVGYFTRNKVVFEQFNDLIMMKLKEAVTTGNIKEMEVSASIINKHTKSLIAKINSERPRWRLSPFTLGWPFNRLSNNFAELLIGDLDKKIVKLRTFVRDTKEYISIQSKHNDISDPIMLTVLSPDLPLEEKDELSSSEVEEKIQIIQVPAGMVSPAVVVTNSPPQPVVILDAEQSNKKFIGWIGRLNQIIGEWQDKDFSYDLKILSSHKAAKDILKQCLDHRKNEDYFLIISETAKEFAKSIKLLLMVNEDAISKKSISQLNLLIEIIEIFTLPLGHELLAAKVEKFNSNSKNIRIYGYQKHGLLNTVAEQKEYKHENEEKYAEEKVQSPQSIKSRGYSQ